MNRCEECGHHDTYTDTLRRRYRRWKAVRRAQKRMRPPTESQRYTNLLAKYEHLALDREVWIKRAHGQDPAWPSVYQGSRPNNEVD